MLIERAIVSTDSNPIYYEFWPLVARGWRNFNIEPTAAVIGELNLDYAFGTVIKMPAIEDIPSDFVAQVIRFIIPCFFPEEVSITSDMDMIPLSRDYFTRQITACKNDDILIFSADAYKEELRYPMCYIAAKGKYFQQIIGLKDLEPGTIREFIRYLFSLNKKWATDELFFAEMLHKSPLLKQTVFLSRGGWNPCAKNRIDRVAWRYSKFGLMTDRYIDAHSLRPLHTNMKEISGIADYLNCGSSGKKYLLHLLKRPLKSAYDQMGRLKQNFFRKSIYAIARSQEITDCRDKIISFSLYGNSPRYSRQLVEVLASYKKLYPDWKCRVYAAKDLREETLQLITSSGSELFLMDSEGTNAAYMLWRFLAIEDRNARAFLIRDLDSMPSPREKLMVDQWLGSGKSFHIIRDHVNHGIKIMGGLWGILTNDFNIRKESRKILLGNRYGVDQAFLEQLVFPRIKDDVLIHDSFPRYPDESPVVIPIAEDEPFIGGILTDDVLMQRDRDQLKTHLIKNFTIQ